MSIDEPASGMGSGALLEDNGRGEEYRTLQVLERAVNSGWDVPAVMRPKIVDRLYEITQRPSVEVLTKAGVFDSVGDADSNATAAARVLLGMTGQTQADRHHTEKLAQDDKHLAVSWADQLAKANPDELIEAAIRLGLVDKLPPAMRERAKARMK